MVEAAMGMKMMIGRPILLHPVVRTLSVVLSIALAAYFLWLVSSGGHAGYVAWAGLLCMTAFNLAFEQAKAENGARAFSDRSESGRIPNRLKI